MKEEKIKALNKRILDAYPDEKLVLGRGNLNSPIVLVGEAPGRKEVEFNEPFVGQAGKHLDEFLQVLELDKEDIYITNSVKYRPTKLNPKTGRLSNRTPTAKEIESFRSFLLEEIDIIKPKIIVTLGNTSLKSLFEKDVKIGDVHGKLISVEIYDNKYNLFPLYHPAAVIYNRSLKEVYLNDLQNLKKELNKIEKSIDKN
ncbi:MAG: uracil-DNA glycosylase [Tissierellia bacterium]|nr:uracil-DNA glycosylase [Tissierellia bacterium]